MISNQNRLIAVTATVQFVEESLALPMALIAQLQNQIFVGQQARKY